MNRVLNAIEGAEKLLKNRVEKGMVSQKELDDASVKMDLSSEELTVFKNTNSLAAANGNLNHEESMTVYAFLSEGLDINKRSLATKLTLTKLMADLMSKNMA
jgi:hypothetical protein